MTKKLCILLATVAALAFAVPSIASAAEATVPAGTRAPVGTEVTMSGQSFALTTTNLGPISCSTFTPNIRLSKNDGTTVEGSGNNPNPITSGCQNRGQVISLTEFNITKLFANGTAASGTKFGTMSFTTTWDLPAGITCKFTGTEVKYEYTYKTNVIKFNSATGVTSTGGCGSTKLDGTFTLEKRGTTTPVIFD